MNKRALIIAAGAVAAIVLFFIIFNFAFKAVKPNIKNMSEAGSLMSKATDYENKNNLTKARAAYQDIVEKFPDSSDIAKAQNNLDNINMKILFSPEVTEDSFLYEVKKGDSLFRLAKKFDTTVDLIMKANNLSNANIRIGQQLKITKAKFSIVVDKSQNILTLKSGDKIIKTYRVSTGASFSTPVGNFKIINKISDPTWYTAGAVVPSDSPKNILGTRWLGINRTGYGIHGTTDSSTIGQNVTAGCVRMTNPEVEELYTIVPVGTEVVIVD